VKDDLRAWFTDENGNFILTVSLLQPQPSAPASGSDNAIDVLLLMLPDLRNALNQLVDLQGAQISWIKLYALPIRGIPLIKHRCLVVGLQWPATALLRLDRRLGNNISLWRAILPVEGGNEAHDEAMFTVTGNIIEGGNCENRQLFEQQLTLRDLNIALQIVCKLLGGYKLLSSNCWFFCSVIQKLLKASHGGSFSGCEPKHRHGGQDLLLKIYAEYISVVCTAGVAAKQEKPQRDSLQPKQEVGDPPASGAEARYSPPPDVHSEHHKPNPFAIPESLPILDSLQPCIPEIPDRKVVPGSDAPQGQAPNLSSARIQPPPAISHVFSGS